MPIHLLLKLFILLVITLWIVNSQSTFYNSSLCADIEIDSLHYFINIQQANKDLSFTVNNTIFTYNLCNSVEVYCRSQNAVLSASMVLLNVSTDTCLTYVQSSITYIDNLTPKSGIKVKYLSLPVTNTSQQYYMYYACNSTHFVGCPKVESGVMWEYFTQNIITYTIIIEVVGVILMVLGIYIYRGSIVLIGWGTAFIILTMI